MAPTLLGSLSGFHVSEKVRQRGRFLKTGKGGKTLEGCGSRSQGFSCFKHPIFIFYFYISVNKSRSRGEEHTAYLALCLQHSAKKLVLRLPALLVLPNVLKLIISQGPQRIWHQPLETAEEGVAHNFNSVGFIDLF